jgi:hypothetical protein
MSETETSLGALRRKRGLSLDTSVEASFTLADDVQPPKLPPI